MGADRHDERPENREDDEIRPLISRLLRRSPVREVPERLLEGKQLARILSVIAKNYDRFFEHEKEAAAAAWALGRTELDVDDGELAVEALADMLSGGHWIREMQARYRSYAIYSAGTGVLLAFMRLLSGNGLTAANYFTTWLFYGPLCGVVVFGLLSYAISPSKPSGDFALAAAVASLARMGAVEAIPELVAALHDVPASTKADLLGSNTPRRLAAASALQTLLTSLTTEHFGQVPHASILALGRMAGDWDPALAGMALEALEKVGTPAAIPAVERVAGQSDVPDVRNAAGRVLAVLREREILLREASTLVRPASAPEDETLLRPASATQTQEELLLHPSAAEEREGPR